MAPEVIPFVERLRTAIRSHSMSLDFHENHYRSEAGSQSTYDENKLRAQNIYEIGNRIMQDSANLLPLLTDEDEEKDELITQMNNLKTRYFVLNSGLQRSIRKSEEERQNAYSVPLVVKQQQPSQQNARSVKIKPIEPPEFDGSVEKWISFRDVFESIVHTNDNLDDIQKFHYLRQSVKIPSNQANILDSFTFNASNYEDAWTAVKRRYNDARKIIDFHLSSLFSTKRMVNGSSTELRKLIDSFTSNLSSLKQQGYVVDDCDDLANVLLVHLVTHRLDDDTLRDWRKFHQEDTATLCQLLDFLEAQQRSLDDRQLSKKFNLKQSVEVKPKSSKTFTSNGQSNNVQKGNSAPQRSCLLCKESHYLWGCPKFIQMSVNDRHKLVQEQSLCFNCLTKGHNSQNCSSKHSCKVCKKQHHTLLHFENNSSKSSSPSTGETNKVQTNLEPNVQPFRPAQLVKKITASASESLSNAALQSNNKLNCYHTLLSTVSLQVADFEGQFHLGRALLDSGSDTNFMTKSFAERLGLHFEDHITSLTGISGTTSTVKFRTKSTIRSNYEEYVKQLMFTVLEDITGNLPGHTIETNNFDIPHRYQLADPRFNESGPIDILLNSEVFYDCLLSQKIRLNNGPMLIHTKFGWIVGGNVNETLTNSLHASLLSTFSFTTKTLIDGLDEQLQKFFEIENFEGQKSLSAEEKYCEQLFTSTTTRDENGKFIVMLPFKENKKPLGRNLANAMRMSFAQESRRQKDETLDKLYCEYMNDYIVSKHITEVSPHNVDFAHYLPHHGVVKMTSSSTKLRPVFNASSVSETGISLNDVLCAGPTVQPESIDIVMRFREDPFVIMADIEKMYRQVWVHPSQRDYLRFLWRDDNTQPLKHYHHNTVPFGTKSAPFLATRVINQIAIDNETTFPQASAIIRRSFYVDDLGFGFKSIEQGIVLRDQIRYMTLKAGMKLTKFAANDPAILEGLAVRDIQPTGVDNSIIKILGITYDSHNDEFSYRLKSMRGGRVTRASVLSEIASIYDPIGWIGPVVLTAKLFMKQLWLTRNQFSWNDVLPEIDENQWDNIRSTIEAVNDIKIARHCFAKNFKTIELHGFCDASESAYGAVIYALTTDEQDEVQISILCAKSRVAPKSQKTLARLELCAATLLSKLIRRTQTTLTTSISEVTLWSDSTIVLNWIVIPLTKLTTFVANRVSVIQELTHTYTWKHIKGTYNPADVISRGLMPNEIKAHSLWWNGPYFLREPKDAWPESQIVISEDDPDIRTEMKKTFFVKTPNDLFTFIENRFSRFQVLINTMAYVRRYTQLSLVRVGPLTLDEIQEAETHVIRIVQQNLFPEEYKHLIETRFPTDDVIQPHQQQHQAKISKTSSLISLAPFIDENGLIRVGGRIDHSPELTYDQKHQILLPQCRFTTLIIRHLHRIHLHPGPMLMLSIIRERYWPVRAKSAIRKVTHECITCFRAKPQLTQQFMSDLPPARVTMTVPFTNTAIDYAGFYTIKTGTTRNAPSTKCYISMFKCMCTGAIHLEVVSDLTTQAFIAAFTRFVSRRSKPNECFTDNGTCFEGADNELKKIITDMEKDVIQFYTDQAIRWNFTTPRAPHAGGIYESGIKSMKHHLKRIFQKSFNFEQLTTVLCKIEAILNSRPITPMSEDPNDLKVLTPGHFLVGRTLISLPERNFINVPTTRLKLWQQIQQTTQQFWHSWYHDYLHNLQKRPKHFREKFEVRVGDMVLLVDRNLPSMKWMMGRVIQLFPSKRSKIVRNVKVITQFGTKERDIRYLCFLPFERQPEDDNNHSRQQELVAQCSTSNEGL